MKHARPCFGNGRGRRHCLVRQCAAWLLLSGHLSTRTLSQKPVMLIAARKELITRHHCELRPLELRSFLEVLVAAALACARHNFRAKACRMLIALLTPEIPQLRSPPFNLNRTCESLELLRAFVRTLSKTSTERMVITAAAAAAAPSHVRAQKRQRSG